MLRQSKKQVLLPAKPVFNIDIVLFVKLKILKTKQMKKLIFLALVAITFFGFIACNKQNPEPSFHNYLQEDPSSLNKSTDLVNPYTYVGQLHNSSLYEIGQQTDTSTFTIQQACNIAKLHLDATATSQTITNSLVSDIATDLENVNLLNSMDVVANLHASNKLDKEVRDAYEEIYQSVIGAEKQTLSTETELFDYLTNNLTNLEQSFITRTFQSEQNRMLVLGAVSTAINSTAFWRDANTNAHHPYHAVMNKLKKKPCRFWCWVGRIGQVVMGDAVGAVLGAVRGGTGGAIVGGAAASGAVVIGLVTVTP